MEDEPGRCFICSAVLSSESHRHLHAAPARPVCVCDRCVQPSPAQWVRAFVRGGAAERLTAWNAEGARVQ
jgi:hypothetical protein